MLFNGKFENARNLFLRVDGRFLEHGWRRSSWPWTSVNSDGLRWSRCVVLQLPDLSVRVLCAHVSPSFFF